VATFPGEPRSDSFPLCFFPSPFPGELPVISGTWFFVLDICVTALNTVANCGLTSILNFWFHCFHCFHFWHLQYIFLCIVLYSPGKRAVKSVCVCVCVCVSVSVSLLYLMFVFNCPSLLRVTLLLYFPVKPSVLKGKLLVLWSRCFIGEKPFLSPNELVKPLTLKTDNQSVWENSCCIVQTLLPFFLFFCIAALYIYIAHAHDL